MVRPSRRRTVGTPSRRVRTRRVGSALLVALLVGACTGTPPGADPTPTAAAVRVGTGPDPEQRLLAEFAAAMVRDAGITAEVVQLAEAADARRALELGDVDVLPGYTGEAWLRVLERADPPSDQATSLARVREHDEPDGLRWLGPRVSVTRELAAPPADATFAFVVDGDGPHADVVTFSQLATRLGELESPALCVDPNFAQRPDGLAVLLDAYSLALGPDALLAVEPPDAVLGVAAGDCDAGLTHATDGRAWLAGQRPLIDDLGVFPAFVVAPVVRVGALIAVPGLEDALQPWLDGLTTARLGAWNARVVAGEEPADVAVTAVEELAAS